MFHLVCFELLFRWCPPSHLSQTSFHLHPPTLYVAWSDSLPWRKESRNLHNPCHRRVTVFKTFLFASSAFVITWSGWIFPLLISILQLRSEKFYLSLKPSPKKKRKRKTIFTFNLFGPRKSFFFLQGDDVDKIRRRRRSFVLFIVMTMANLLPLK